MQLPHAERAIIAPEKLREYLLSERHQKGRNEARVLRRLGFDAAHPEELDAALRQHLGMDAIPAERNLYGQKYEIVAPLRGPLGAEVIIKSVWIVLNGETNPRFVTAYPRKRASG